MKIQSSVDLTRFHTVAYRAKKRQMTAIAPNTIHDKCLARLAISAIKPVTAKVAPIANNRSDREGVPACN